MRSDISHGLLQLGGDDPQGAMHKGMVGTVVGECARALGNETERLALAQSA